MAEPLKKHEGPKIRYGTHGDTPHGMKLLDGIQQDFNRGVKYFVTEAASKEHQDGSKRYGIIPAEHGLNFKKGIDQLLEQNRDVKIVPLEGKLTEHFKGRRTAVNLGLVSPDMLVKDIKAMHEGTANRDAPFAKIFHYFGAEPLVTHMRDLDMRINLETFLSENPDARGNMTGLIGGNHFEAHRDILGEHGEYAEKKETDRGIPGETISKRLSNSWLGKEPPLTEKEVEDLAIQSSLMVKRMHVNGAVHTAEKSDRVRLEYEASDYAREHKDAILSLSPDKRLGLLDALGSYSESKRKFDNLMFKRKYIENFGEREGVEMSQDEYGNQLESRAGELEQTRDNLFKSLSEHIETA